ncbi:hypothetical protein SK128_009438 [Halocaridina rubra]|uniref:Uncharacterized protein n=1 Tax=Halocaridina rubra TaxID=373956 RepID=A0AAN8WA18_HALRR
MSSAAVLRRLLHRSCSSVQFKTSCVNANVRCLSISAKMDQKVLTIDNMNPLVKKMEYAVRGPLVIRATAIEKDLEAY